MAEYPAFRHTRAAIAEEVRMETEEPNNSVAVQAAKEVDSERREIDEEIVERMRARQRYFFEKSQMYRESADHYQRMSEDIAELLNNDYVNGPREALKMHTPEDYRASRKRHGMDE